MVVESDADCSRPCYVRGSGAIAVLTIIGKLGALAPGSAPRDEVTVTTGPGARVPDAAGSALRIVFPVEPATSCRSESNGIRSISSIDRNSLWRDAIIKVVRVSPRGRPIRRARGRDILSSLMLARGRIDGLY